MSLALPDTAAPAPSLADQLLAFRRRWRLILLCACLLPGITVLALWRLPPSYIATGTLLYDPDNGALPGDAPARLTDAQNQDAITASQAAMITALPAASAIAAQLNLAQNPAFNPALRHHGWLSGLFGPRQAPGDAVIAEAVRRALSVTVLPGSRVLAVSFSCDDPALAARAANLAMQLYIAHERDQAFASLTDAQTWLETHAADAQTTLDSTESALAAARAKAGLVQGAQASLTTETASRIAASLVSAQADLAMNQARLAASQRGGAAAADAAIAPNLLPLRKEQADLAAQVQSLRGEYGPDYPALRSARTQLDAITSEINAETGRELSAAQANVAADQAEIATLQGALAAARNASETEDEESAPVRALEQRAEAGRATLKAMTLQAAQLAQDASLIKPDARILSDAAPPAAPSGPDHALVLAAAAALGLCMGLLLAGLAEALDTSLRSGGAVRTALGLPCLALVPESNAPKTLALEAPFSLFAEQLRALRTALGLGRGSARVIALTAARPAEGKTTLSIAFARSLSAAGLKVLAVDGDVRQPSFDPVFSTGGAPGLTDHLAGLSPLDACIARDRLTDLDILPAGTQAQAALSLFLGEALPACLTILRARYDVIVLDVPPAYALAEGRVLARLADEAVLCVRWGHTPSRVVEGAVTLLREAGVTLAGVALTRVNPRLHGRSGFADAEIYQPRYGGYFKA